MAKYLVQATYTSEGLKGLLKEGGTGRVKAIEALIKSAGGKVEAVYFAFGETDVYVIVDMPDNESAAAVSLAAGSAGMSSSKLTTLKTPEEVDSATGKAVDFRAPGK